MNRIFIQYAIQYLNICHTNTVWVCDHIHFPSSLLLLFFLKTFFNMPPTVPGENWFLFISTQYKIYKCTLENCLSCVIHHIALTAWDNALQTFPIILHLNFIAMQPQWYLWQKWMLTWCWPIRHLKQVSNVCLISIHHNNPLIIDNGFQGVLGIKLIG